MRMNKKKEKLIASAAAEVILTILLCSMDDLFRENQVLLKLVCKGIVIAAIIAIFYFVQIKPEK